MSAVEITVPLVPPSGNAMRRKYRHWAAYRKLKELWAHNLRYSVTPEQNVNLYEAAMLLQKRMRVEFTIYVPQVRDEDNCMAGLKPILDALQLQCGREGRNGLGWIYTDDPRYLELPKPVQVKCKRKESRTVLRVSVS